MAVTKVTDRQQVQNVDLTSEVSGLLPIANGGTGASSLTAAGIVDTSSAQTLTNKTLTSPKINTIYDVNGNPILGFNPNASAANYLEVVNFPAASNSPTFSAAGADTNIGIAFQPKGTGDIAWVGRNSIHLYTNSGFTPDFWSNGPDSNISINFTPKGNGRLTVGSVNVPTVSSTDTLTNKRITKRKISPAVAGTYTIDLTATDLYVIGTQNAAITNLTTTGTPDDGHQVMIRIKGDATPRAITWDSAKIVSSGTATLLATTAANKTHHIGLMYDSTLGKMVCLAVDSTGY